MQALLRANPDIERAAAEVDRPLIRAGLKLSPLQRLQAASFHFIAPRRFKRAALRRSEALPNAASNAAKL
jgi:hypothetical protein